MKKITVLAILFLILLVPTGVALAAPPLNTVVASGETVNNEIVLFDDDLDVEEGATVNGNVTLFNGDAYVAGTINGDLVLFSGDLEAASTAVLNGQCVVMNGHVEDNTESGLRCTKVDNLSNFIPALSNLPGVASVWRSASSEVNIEMPQRSFFANLAEAVVSGLLMGALAFVVGSLLPQHLGQVQHTIRQKPLASGAVGLLTAVAVPSLIAILSVISAILLLVCIGILGFGLVLALALGLAAGLLFGWIAVGNLVGQWLAGPLKLKDRRVAVTAALGTLIITFFINLLEGIPYIFGEGLISAIALFLGLGAVALTQFGSKMYPREAGTGVYVQEDEGKVTAVLDTLPMEDPADFKD